MKIAGSNVANPNSRKLILQYAERWAMTGSSRLDQKPA